MQHLKRQAPRLLVLLLLAVSASYLWTATAIPLDFWSESERFNARSMPYLAGGIAVIVASLLLIWPGMRPNLDAYDLMLPRPGTRTFSTLLLVGLMFAYPAGLTWLGFPIATGIFLMLAFRVMGERRLPVGAAIACALAVTFWLLMNQLGIHLAVTPWFLRGASDA